MTLGEEYQSAAKPFIIPKGETSITFIAEYEYKYYAALIRNWIGTENVDINLQIKLYETNDVEDINITIGNEIYYLSIPFITLYGNNITKDSFVYQNYKWQIARNWGIKYFPRYTKTLTIDDAFSNGVFYSNIGSASGTSEDDLISLDNKTFTVSTNVDGTSTEGYIVYQKENTSYEDVTDIILLSQLDNLLKLKQLDNETMIIFNKNIYFSIIRENNTLFDEIKELIPEKTSDLTNDSGFITKEVNNLTHYTKTTDMEQSISNAIAIETTNRQNADLNLQNQIDAIVSASDVVDVVSSYTDLQNYDTSKLTADDIIKVMQDSTHNNAISYYRWIVTSSNVGAWNYVGSEGPYYTKGETDNLLNNKQDKIDNENKLGSDLVDDTNGTNKFTNTTEKATWNAKYTKPASGIPKADLAENVQTSLGKADTALQQHQDISGKEDKSNKVTSIDENSTNTQYPGAKVVYDELVQIEELIPEKTSDLTNDSGFITKEVNNLTNYTLKTSTGSSIELSINSTTYVMTLNLKDINGNVISTGSIDLPLETMVVSASYDNTTKEIILTLQSGTTVRFSVADLVSGLVIETTFNTTVQSLQQSINTKQNEITSSNKLSSDLIDDTNKTNKFVTANEKAQITTNQNAITNIKDGTNIDSFADVESELASKGTYSKPSTGIPKTDLASDVQTSLGKADTALQTHQDISGKENTTNKVTVINANSTNQQYPSALAVYNYIQSLDGNEVEY